MEYLANLLTRYYTKCYVGSPYGLTATAYNDTRIDLEWSNTTIYDNILIERSYDGINFALIDTIDGTDSNYSNAGINPNTHYYYRVRGITDGEYSDYSNIADEWTYIIIKFGLLYNWYTIIDARNITNTGWHVATDTEYNTLITYLSSNQGGKIKEIGFIYWDMPNTGATNEVGFNARGSGVRGSEDFDAIKTACVFWSATQEDANNAWAWLLHNDDAIFSHGLSGAPKEYGYTIRLIKDSTILSNGETSIYVGNDGKIYDTICIGTQEWLSENLAETKYRNGDNIPEITDSIIWAALITGALCAYENDWDNV